MSKILPEKARVLTILKDGHFTIPDFVFISAEDFKKGTFGNLDAFLAKYRNNFKVVVRSAHPYEEFYKGGTFDSLETYSDIGGITYARKKIISSLGGANRLSILRQQKFNGAPPIDPEEMGVIVMPYIEGINIMAKKVGSYWEFGYSGNRRHKVQSDPYITATPHDRKLLQISIDIQRYLGFTCEIEYVASTDGEIYVVQAKDISNIEILEEKESARSIRLDGIRRIRKRRNYRERPVYVMDNKKFYLSVINKCEDMVHCWGDTNVEIEEILAVISSYEEELENFALRHQRFAVLGLCLHVPEDLFQIANHYLDDAIELQSRLSNALHDNLYKIDYFLGEADTLITEEKIRLSLCTHDAYGIDTVRNPLWSVYWSADKHDYYVKRFMELGYKTGDSVGIEVDVENRPTIFRL